jgi:enamine deaminase RidA (YjgF/YER057c/UK114 family)
MVRSSHRRGFVSAALTCVGAAVLPGRRVFALGAGRAVAQGAESRLKELGITLPAPPSPVATYVPAVKVGNLLFVSGHGPAAAPDKKLNAGKVGRDLTLEEGRAAARLVGLNVLASVRNTLGSLDRVVRVVKVLGMVNAAPDFTQQPQVVNGFSDLMVEIFGQDRGKGARSAVGMGSLPNNIPVEVEAIFEVEG